MEKLDFKKLAVIGAILAIILIVIVVKISTKTEKEVVGETEVKDTNVTKTNEAPVNLSSSGTKSKKLLNNFLEPTLEEQAELYNLYGYGNVEFTSQGVVISRGPYDMNAETRLLTDVWPDTNYTNKIIKPEFGEFNQIEVAETYVIIIICDAEENDVKDYAKQVKDEFSKKIDNAKKIVVYEGENEEGASVLVMYNEITDVATIKYKY